MDLKSKELDQEDLERENAALRLTCGALSLLLTFSLSLLAYVYMWGLHGL